MSNKQNDTWIESAFENFEQAIADGDFNFARAVVQDVRDSGFRESAARMELLLKDSMITSHHAQAAQIIEEGLKKI